MQALRGAQNVSIHETPVVEGFLPSIERGILKFDLHSVGELFGYQLAAILGVRIPRIAGYWITEPLGQPFPAAAGRIGALVEYFPDWRTIALEEAATSDPDVTARALALCAFDRFEWGEFGVSNGRICFVDLERLLAPVVPDLWAEMTRRQIKRDIEKHIQGFLRIQRLELPGVMEAATSLGLAGAVRRHLLSLDPESAEQLRIEQHPFAELLSDAYRRCARLAMENLHAALR